MLSSPGQGRKECGESRQALRFVPLWAPHHSSNFRFWRTRLADDVEGGFSWRKLDNRGPKLGRRDGAKKVKTSHIRTKDNKIFYHI